MKYIKRIIAAIFICLLVVTVNYDILFRKYGLMQSLDMQFGYTANDVYSSLIMLGADGRKLYLNYFLTDFIFVFFYGVIQLWVLNWALGDNLNNTKFKYLKIIPIIRAIFDIVENACFMFLLIKMPEKYIRIIPELSIVTQIKLIANYGWYITILVLIIIKIVSHFSKIKKLKK